LAGANLLHLFDFDDFIGEPEKRKKKKEKEMMKMFGIRGKEEKNKNKWRATWPFPTNELHEFTFNTRTKNAYGERMAQLKEEKRHKGERKKGSEIPRGREKPFRLGYSEADNHPLDEANAHNEWVLLQQPSSYPLFFFLSLLRRRRRRKEKWVIRKMWEREEMIGGGRSRVVMLKTIGGTRWYCWPKSREKNLKKENKRTRSSFFFFYEMEEEEERARPTQVSKVIPVDHPSVLELARGVSGLVDKVFYFIFIFTDPGGWRGKVVSQQLDTF
jgi:hypothetical protein